MIEHGGRLRRAALASGQPVEEWFDLSTGIGPFPWPVPAIPDRCWSRLPEDDDGLLDAACAYYGAESLLAVDGSQCAIQLLPRLLGSRNVAVVSPAYAEHAHSWRQAGSQVHELDYGKVEERLDDFDAVVLVNPNNPTGEYRHRRELLRWHKSLSARGGWLVVDEAFMDPTPERSLIKDTSRQGLVVLRSFGKFFGCPGARLGFVAANPSLLEGLRELVGPWAVSGPSRWIGTLALQDSVWREQTRIRLQKASFELAELLTDFGLKPDGGTPLFQWVRHQHAREIYEHFLNKSILLRWFPALGGLRFGLPGSTDEWRRLEAAMRELPTILLTTKEAYHENS